MFSIAYFLCNTFLYRELHRHFTVLVECLAFKLNTNYSRYIMQNSRNFFEDFEEVKLVCLSSMLIFKLKTKVNEFMLCMYVLKKILTKNAKMSRV